VAKEIYRVAWSTRPPSEYTRENNWKSLGEQLWQRKGQTGWRSPLDPRLNTRENNWKSSEEQLWQRKNHSFTEILRRGLILILFLEFR
jgi:hypothetical protein